MTDQKRTVMETILGRFRNLIVLAAILFAQIVGLAIQVKRPAQQGDTRLIRVWAVSAITPFEKAVVSTQNFFYGAWHNYVYLRGVRRENRELRAQLDQMKLRSGTSARRCRDGAPPPEPARLQRAAHRLHRCGAGDRHQRQRSVARALHRQRFQRRHSHRHGGHHARTASSARSSRFFPTRRRCCPSTIS